MSLTEKRWTVLWSFMGHDWKIVKTRPEDAVWFTAGYWEAYRVWCHLKDLSHKEGQDKYYELKNSNHEIHKDWKNGPARGK
jgi:hypothetical protein